jgi:hypothetical protein
LWTMLLAVQIKCVAKNNCCTEACVSAPIGDHFTD